MKLRQIICGIFCIWLFGIVVAYVFERNQGLLCVYFLDIGQGDAIYIRTPSGNDMLIDGGPSKVVLQKLAEVMPWYDKSLDVVMETHPDADHIGGLPEVLNRYRVGQFLEPGIESKNAIDDEIRRLRDEKSIPGIFARQGMRVDFGDGAYFDVLFPAGDVSEFKDTNEASIVGQLLYGSTTVMLTGDSPKKIENYLIDLYGAELRSNVLKAGHHGSRTSSGEDYVTLVSPEYAVISAGYKNRYGHPHTEVLEIFKKYDIKVMRTDESGTIEFISDGAKIFPKQK